MGRERGIYRERVKHEYASSLGRTAFRTDALIRWTMGAMDEYACGMMRCSLQGKPQWVQVMYHHRRRPHEQPSPDLLTRVGGKIKGICARGVLPLPSILIITRAATDTCSKTGHHPTKLSYCCRHSTTSRHQTAPTSIAQCTTPKLPHTVGSFQLG